jgi:hypothetical protein
MANLKLRKKVSAKTFNEVRLKMIGQKFNKSEIYEILTGKCGLKKSYYLVKVLTDMKLIRKDDSGNYYFPDNYPATDPLLQQAMQDVRKKEIPTSSKIDEKKAIELLKSLKNEDGTNKYIIQRFVPATYETL